MVQSHRHELHTCPPYWLQRKGNPTLAGSGTAILKELQQGSLPTAPVNPTSHSVSKKGKYITEVQALSCTTFSEYFYAAVHKAMVALGHAVLLSMGHMKHASS